MTLMELFFGRRERKIGAKKLNRDQFKQKIKGSNAVLLDVRTAREFNEGHIQNARNLDFFKQSDFLRGINALNREKPVFVYCRSGNRSAKAAKRMIRMGFREVYDLGGGYINWN